MIIAAPQISGTTLLIVTAICAFVGALVGGYLGRK
jgi:hypothetical protein